MSEVPVISVRVVCALADEAREISLEVPATAGAREVLRQAIRAGLRLDGTGLDADRAPLGVHGRRVADNEPLQADDRLELYRPLEQDPMERRRREAARGSASG